VDPPRGLDDWVAIGADPLPLADALAWAVTARCGALVSFSGTVRDHSEGRPGVVRLDYECYPGAAERALADVARSARARWPELGRLVLLHRTGTLAPEEIAVVVVATAPSRDVAFAAARYLIDTVKAAVPIWKRETWANGEAWALGAQRLRAPDARPEARGGCEGIAP